MAVKFKSNLINPFEKLYYDSKNNPLFKENDWEELLTYGKDSDAISYAKLIKEANEKGLSDKFINDDLLNEFDVNDKLFFLSNNLGYTDDTELKEFDVFKEYDANGEAIYEKQQLTEKQYYNKLFAERTNLIKQQQLLQQIEDAKAQKNIFHQIWDHTLAIGGNLLANAYKGVEDVINLADALVMSASSMFDLTEGIDKNWNDAVDRFGKLMSDDLALTELNGSATGDDFIRAIADFERDNTYFRTADGNYTTVGKYVGGISSSVGQMLPSIAMTFVGLPGWVGQTTFYAGILSNGIQENIREHPSVSTEFNTMEAVFETAAEFAIEYGLGKVFGNTLSDVARGVSGTGKFSTGLKRWLGDAMQEGLEESLQEISSWVVSNAAGLIRDEYRTDITIEQIFDAAVTGFLSSLITGGMGVIRSTMYDNTMSKLHVLTDKSYDALGSVDGVKETREQKKYRRGKYQAVKAAREIDNLTNPNKTLETSLYSDFQKKRLGGGFTAVANTFEALTKDIDVNSERGKKVLAELKTQLYIGYKTMMDLYGEFGQERAVAAEKLLNELDTYSEQNYTSKYREVNETLTKQMSNLYDDYKKYDIAKQVKANTPEEKEEEEKTNKKSVKKEKRKTAAEKAEKEGKVDKKDNVKVTKEDLDLVDKALEMTDNEVINLPEEEREIVKNIRILSKKYEHDFVLWDNWKIMEEDSVIFANKDAAKNLTAEELIKSASERTIAVKYKTAIPTAVKNHFVELFKDFAKQSGLDLTKSKEKVDDLTMFNLLYNVNFYNYLLYRGDITAFNILKTVDNTINELVKQNGNIHMVSAYYAALKRIRKSIGPALAMYFCNNPYANMDKVTIFTDSQLKFIQEHRNNVYMSDVIINTRTDDPNYKNYINAVINRINALAINDERKTSLKSTFEQDFDKNNVYYKFSRFSREGALNEINAYYGTQLYKLYDDKHRLSNDSGGNAMFNSWLESTGLTVKQVLDNDLPMKMRGEVIKVYGENNTENRRKYLTDSFKNFTNNALSFEVEYAQEPTVEELRNWTDEEKAKYELYKKELDGLSDEDKTPETLLKLREKYLPDNRKLKVIELKTSTVNIDKNYVSPYIYERMLNSWTYTDTEFLYANIDNYIKDSLNVNDIELTYTTIEDIVNNPYKLLNNVALSKIEKEYGVVNKQNVVSYLRKEVVSKSEGRNDIVLTNDNKFVPANMCNIFDFVNEKYKSKLSEVVRYEEADLDDVMLSNINGDKRYVTRDLYDENNKLVYKYPDELTADEYKSIKNKKLYVKILGNYSIFDTLDTKPGTQYTISEFITDKKLPAPIKNVKIEFIAQDPNTPGLGGYYSSLDNIIYIVNRREPNYSFINTIVHEFQHVYQHFNNLAQGAQFGIKVTQEMIDDFSKHVPFIAESVNKADTVRRFVYYTAFGEQMSRGTYSQHVDVYPTWIDTSENRIKITTAWGTVHKTKPANNAAEMRVSQSQSISVDNKDGEITRTTLDTKRKVPANLDDVYRDSKKYQERINAALKIRKEKKDKNEPVYKKDFKHLKLPSDILDKIVNNTYRKGTDEKYEDAKIYISMYKKQLTKQFHRQQKKENKSSEKRRQVFLKNAKGTNLMFWVNKYNDYIPSLSPAVYDFVKMADDLDKLPEELVNKIKNATLIESDIYNYVRDVDEINDYTWDAIKKTFFKNTPFETFADVKKFVKNDVVLKAFALKAVYESTGDDKDKDNVYIKRNWTVDKFIQFFNTFEKLIDENSEEYKKLSDGEKAKSKKLAKVYYKTMSSFGVDIINIKAKDKKEEQAAIEKSLRNKNYVLNIEQASADITLGLLQFFDNTLDSLAYVGGNAKYALSKEQATGKPFTYKSKKDAGMTQGTMSIDSTIKGKKGDDSDRTLEEVVAATKDRFLFDSADDEADAKEILKNAFRTYLGRIVKVFTKNGVLKVKALNKALTNLGFEKVSETDFVGSLQKANKNLLKWIRNLNADEAINRAAFVLSMETTGLTALQCLGLEDIDGMNVDNLEAVTESEAEQAETENVTTEKKKLITKQSNRVRSLIRNIAENLRGNHKRYSLMDDKYKKYFNEKSHYDFMRGSLKGLSYDELVDLQNELKEISSKMSKGDYDSKANLNKASKIEKENRKQAKKIIELEKRVNELNEKLKEKSGVTFNITDEVNIKSDRPVPEKLRKLLNITLTHSRASKIKIDNLKGERILGIRMQEFYDLNAETFAAMTYEDALDIVEFFENSSIANADYTAYHSFKMFTLAYIVEQIQTYQTWIDTDNLHQRSERMIANIVQNAASVLGGWKGVIKKVNPQKVIIQSIAVSCDIRLTDDEVQPLLDVLAKFRRADQQTYHKIKQMKNDGRWDQLTPDEQKEMLLLAEGKVKSIDDVKLLRDLTSELNQVLANIQSIAIAKRKENLKHASRRQIQDNILKFQKAMMLSAPATWVRNSLSNTILSGFDFKEREIRVFGKTLFKLPAWKRNGEVVHIPGMLEISDLLGSIIKPKHKYQPSKGEAIQYDLRKVKVSSDTAQFVKTWLLDTGLLDSVGDGLTKYDSRTTNAKSGDVSLQLQDMIVDAIKSVTLNGYSFKKGWLTKKLEKKAGKEFEHSLTDNFINWIFERSSDSEVIKKQALKYIGKMIEFDKIDFSKGLTSDVMNIIAKGYSMAAYDFMHRSNFISRIESDWKKKNPNSYFAAKLLLPFASSSWNWFLETLQMTPIALFSNMHKLNNLEKVVNNLEYRKKHGELSVPDYRFAEMLIRRNIGKGMIGTALLFLGIALAAFGKISIDEEDEKLKLHVGETWIDVSSIFGTSSLLVGAAMVQPFKEDGVDTVSAISSAIESAFNQQFEDGMTTQFINMFRYKETPFEFMASVPSTIASGFIPNFWKSVVKTTRNYKVEYSSGIYGGIQRYLIQLLPFYDAYGVPRAIDPYTGEEEAIYSMPSIHQLFTALGSPVSFKTYKRSEVEKIFNDYGMRRSMLSGNYKDIGQLDVDELNTFYGKLNNKTVTEFTNNKVRYDVEDERGKKISLYYKQMSDAQIKSVLNRITTQNANYAKIFVWTNSGHKYYCSSDKRLELIKIGINKNVYVGNKGFVK